MRLPEATVDALVKGDIGTVEKLGTMTPEQLEALEGIDEEAVNRIQQAINGYYGQEYGEPASEAAAQEEPAHEAEVPAAESAESAESALVETAEEAGPEAAEEGDSAENAMESASGTMNEPVETIDGAEGEQATEAVVSASPDEPRQAGKQNS